MNSDFDLDNNNQEIAVADDDEQTQDLNESRLNRSVIRKRRVVKKKKKKKVGERSFIGSGRQAEGIESQLYAVSEEVNQELEGAEDNLNKEKEGTLNESILEKVTGAGVSQGIDVEE